MPMPNGKYHPKQIFHETVGLLMREKNGSQGAIIPESGDDSANQLCFRDEPFDDPQFATLAKEVYGPFIHASQNTD